MSELDRYHPDSHRRFLTDTSNHQMTVLRDDGLYRHLMFRQAPHTWLYWYEIVTWPGSLAIHGDMGSFAFSRIEDMFRSFAGSYINPQYWAEKLHNGDGVREFDRDRFVQVVREHWSDRRERYSVTDQREIDQALQIDVLSTAADFKESAFEALRDFQCRGFRFDDWWELNADIYTTRYLWCCHAIREGIRRYHEAQS